MLECFSDLFKKENTNTTVNSTPINSLAPKILSDEKDIKKIKPYLDSLKKAIDADGVTNIALTGGYGSGKSTIIKTFQNLNSEYQYLNISLASFKDIDGENKPKNSKGSVNDSSTDRQLEISILQQIFYHVSPSEIPDSRFKRIVNITDCKIFFIAVGLILWILSTIVIFKFKYINKINPETWILSDSFDLLAFLFFMIFFTGIGFFAKTFIRLFSNSKISKLNIKGELELGDNTDKSVFNQHLEEILYFFERTPYNVVVIEDLDRFDNTDIFTKLREINILLNNSKLINREINFIYAIKDEKFKDKNERVKFFEYIIPVIPFINPSTAGDQLTKLITDAGLEGVLSKDFTEDVVTFIDDIDMRLLINIFHEYQLYNQNLIDELPQDNLFAMIIYKNLFPEDFGDLQKRKGNLCKFISQKSNYADGLIEKINEQIKNKNIENKNIEKETITEIKELRAIYINGVHEKIPNATSLHLNREISFSDLSEDEEFDMLLNSENIRYNFYSPHYNNNNLYLANRNSISNISFSQIEKSVNPNFTYDERAQLIQDKKEDKTQRIKRDIENLSVKKVEIESWSLTKIFEEVDINLHLNGFSNNALVRNLLLNGYINENYNDYISLFHEVNLTREDYVFEKNVKSSIHSEFDYKLTKIENLVPKIAEKYFSRDSILNFDLLDFLAKNQSLYKNKYNSIINLLNNEKARHVHFVFSYIDQREKHIGLFIKSMCKSWDGFWDYIYLKGNFTEEKTKQYFELIVKYADLEDIILPIYDSSIISFIVQQPDFLSLINDKQYEGKIKDLIKSLNIKFESLDPSTEETKDLFDYVYQNNHYLLTADNIALMLSEKNGDKPIEKLNQSNYTTISNSDCKSLIDYVKGNINEYVKNVLLKIPENISESEQVIIDLLNNENLKENLKSEIIKKQNVIINVLSQIINNEIKEKLIQENKILPNWNNIYAYYDELATEDLNETLIDFLNMESNYNSLSKFLLKQDNQKDESFITAFSLCLIQCNGLNQESYEKLIPKIPYTWGSLNFENLDFEKIEWMVNERKILSMSVKNFNRLKEHFPNLHISLIEKNQGVFISKFQEYILDQNDILKLLLSTEFTLENKVILIQKIEDDIIIQNKEIGKTVCNLLSDYKYIPLEYNVLESLFRHSNSTENRIKLLNKHFDKISDQEVTNLIMMLSDNYENIFKKQHKPKFQNTTYHDELFRKLAQKGLIIKYEIDSKDPALIKVLANY